jgi:putative ABC transport system permease protein
MKKDHLFIIVSIAVGTALLACMLASIYAVLIDPLPFPRSNQIVTVHTIEGGVRTSSSIPDYYDLSKSGGPLDNSIYVKSLGGSTEIGGHPESLYSVRFHGNLFSVFEQRPVLGNIGDLNSDVQTNSPVAILSYSAWIRFFDQDPHVLGKIIHIGGTAYEVRAVLSPEYQLALPADVWVAAGHDDTGKRDSRDGRIFARLPPGVSAAAANSYAGTIAASLQESAPDTNQGISFKAFLLKDALAGGSKQLLYLLGLSAAMVLCVAYFNVYQLLAAKLAAGTARWSICLALGAGRRRLFRDMLKEPLLLSVIGCGLGLFLSLLSTHILGTFAPTDIPRIADTRLVWQISLVLFVSSALAATLFTSLMLVRVMSSEMLGGLQSKAHSGVSVHHAFSAKRQSLLIVQIALSATLLISIGMVTIALRKVTDTSLGFNPERVSVTDLFLKQPTNTLAGDEYIGQIMQNVAALPGVESVAVTSSIPFERRSYSATFTGDDMQLGEHKKLQYAAVSPAFFQTLQVRVLQGRVFTASDNSSNIKVAMLNQAAVKAIFGDRDGLNKSFHGDLGSGLSTLEVVGVVENVRQDPTTVVAPPIVYLPLAQAQMYAVSLVVRAKTPVGNAQIKSSIWALNANQPVQLTVRLVDLIDAGLRRIRYLAMLMTLFAAVTITLSAVGIYAAVVQWLSASQREIAVHLALGATYFQIRNAILKRVMVVTGTALALGLLGSLAASNTLQAMLYGVQPRWGAVLVLTVLLLATVSLLASYIPALRSRFIDPATLLRSE